jgi:acetyltransferase-like isoleucine patch superfamily enzyme
MEMIIEEQGRGAWVRRYAYGFLQSVINMSAHIPSQHLRRWALSALGLRLGTYSVIYSGAEIRAPWRVSVGDFASIGNNVVLDGRGGIRIGNSVNISSEVMLWTAQHDYRTRDFQTVLGPIAVEDYVWLGPRVIVLPGVTIGKGCVVAAAAVVTRDTEPFGVYAGVPATRVAERPRDLSYKPGRYYTPFL